MIKRLLILCAGALSLASGANAAPTAEEAAAQFGARENVLGISLSPDGSKVGYVVPTQGQGNALYTVDLATLQPKLATAADGKPLRLNWCRWVSNQRLVCQIYMVMRDGPDLSSSSRLVAVNADGTDMKLVTQLGGTNARWATYYGGGVVDWLPGQDNEVLITRYAIPQERVGSLVERRDEGLAALRINTLTGKTDGVESARRETIAYVSDGRGAVRVMATQSRSDLTGYADNIVKFFYRKKGASAWEALANYDVVTENGLYVLAVDPDRDMAYGLRKKDGRKALYTIALDGSLREELAFEHPSVDVDDVLTMGRERRVVGVTYATDKREAVYFDKAVASQAQALSKALPNLPQTYVVDSSSDGNVLLLWAGSDVDPGNYYVFDRRSKRLNQILLARPQLAQTKLAPVKPISFKAADGTMVPGYLTLPPEGTGKGLPAIVLPHGGPGARDEWGFDWLAQYYAHRGYAVLQPNFRGSTGYGDAWFQQNGFQSWRAAVGDVVDAGRWLVSEGIADPAKLGIVGWSYGGYAALQSGVVAPDLYKAIVAIAPVTDFRLTIEDARYTAAFNLAREEIGSGSHIREGSPLQNAAAIQAPVLLFHGDLDRNVLIRQSRAMSDRLRDLGKKGELVVFPELDHYLDDSKVRASMLSRSDAFLRQSMGL